MIVTLSLYLCADCLSNHQGQQVTCKRCGHVCGRHITASRCKEPGCKCKRFVRGKR